MSTTSSFLLLLLGHVTCSQDLLSTPQRAAWDCKEGPRSSYSFTQIDAGQGQVVATDEHRRAFHLISNTWHYLPHPNVVHMSVGPAGTWGVDFENKVFKLVAGNWTLVPGQALKQVDAGGNPFAVGVNAQCSVYCLGSASSMGYSGAGSVSWVTVSGSLAYYSCGPLGCWGVNNDNKVYVMKTINPLTCQNSGWQHVTGVSLTMIEVSSDGSVFGVSPDGKVYQRSGVSTSNPLGTSWDKIPMCMSMKHVTYDLGRLWLLTVGGSLMVCTQ